MARQKQKTIAAHPGEILRREFMEPVGITAYQLGKDLHFPGVYEMVREQRAISADVALRLGKYFGRTPQFWMTFKPITICGWRHPERREPIAAHPGEGLRAEFLDLYIQLYSILLC